MRVTLATYNIHRCVGHDRCRDPARIIEVIRDLDADVVALQEVESPLGSDIDFLDYLAAETGMTPIAGPTLFGDFGHYGNAVLTRAEVLAVRRLSLSHHGREPRGALDMDLRLKGLTFQVIATHLGLRPWERRSQIAYLLQRFHVDGTKPAALLGDFNEWLPWGRPLRWIHQRFGRQYAPPSFPSRFPLLSLDRVWVHPKSALVSVKAWRRSPARCASDHLPVRVVAEWPEER